MDGNEYQGNGTARKYILLILSFVEWEERPMVGGSRDGAHEIA